MKYTHFSFNLAEMDSRWLEEIRSLQDGDVFYGYQQGLDWALCDAADNEWVITCKKNTVVACSVLRKVSYPFISRCKYIVQGGPVFSSHIALGEHLKYIARIFKDKAIDIRMTPFFSAEQEAAVNSQMLEAGFKLYEPQKSNYTSTVVINTTQHIEKIESDFSSSLKRQLKKAERSEISIKVVSSASDVAMVVSKIIEFYRQRGLGVPRKEMLTCYVQNKIINDKGGLMLFAEIEGEIVAAIIVCKDARRAVYTYGFKCEDKRLRKWPLSHMMHHRAIMWAVENKCEYYDFGGYNTVDPDDGINRFKLGFSREVQQVSGNYICIENIWCHQLNNLMSRLKNIKNKF